MVYTRITDRLLNDNIIDNLLINRSRLNEMNEQLASGKAINRPSDNTVASMNIMFNKKVLGSIDTFKTNIEYAAAELNIADRSVLSAVDVVHRAKELTVQASNSTLGSDQMKDIANEMDQLVNRIVDLGNTRYNSKFLFGGKITDREPYDLEGDSIQYKGTMPDKDFERNVEISQNVTMPINMVADEVFGQYDTSSDPPRQYGLLNTLKTISNELKFDTPSHSNIRDQLDVLDDDLETLLNVQAELGGRLTRLDMTRNKLSDDELTYTRFLSENEDIDLARVISEIKFQETALQASLSASARAIQPSLLGKI